MWQEDIFFMWCEAGRGLLLQQGMMNPEQLPTDRDLDTHRTKLTSRSSPYSEKIASRSPSVKLKLS